MWCFATSPEEVHSYKTKKKTKKTIPASLSHPTVPSAVPEGAVLKFTAFFTDVWTSSVTGMLYHCLLFRCSTGAPKMRHFDLNFIFAACVYFMHTRAVCLTATHIFLLLLTSRESKEGRWGDVKSVCVCVWERGKGTE